MATNNVLLPMDQFMTYQLQSETAETLGKDVERICAVCTLAFAWQELDSDNGDTDVVSTPACKHLFHRQCLVDWLGTTNENRNRCPLDRQTFCQLNELSEEQQEQHEASQADYYGDATNIEAQQLLLQYTDFLVQQQIEEFNIFGQEDYTQVPARVRDTWRRAHPVAAIDDVHHAIGDDYLIYQAASRVVTDLHTRNIESREAGVLFIAWYNAYEAWFQGQHPGAFPEDDTPAPNPFIDNSVDDDSDGGPYSASQQGTSGGEDTDSDLHLSQDESYRMHHNNQGQRFQNAEATRAEISRYIRANPTANEPSVPGLTSTSTYDIGRSDPNATTPEGSPQRLSSDALRDLDSTSSPVSDSSTIAWLEDRLTKGHTSPRAPSLGSPPRRSDVEDNGNPSHPVPSPTPTSHPRPESPSENGGTTPRAASRASTSRRSNSRSPTESRIDDSRREQDHRRFSQSLFRTTYNSLKENYTIVSTFSNPGNIKKIGHRRYRIKVGNSVQILMDVDMAIIGEYACFYRYKD